MLLSLKTGTRFMRQPGRDHDPDREGDGQI